MTDARRLTLPDIATATRLLCAWIQAREEARRAEAELIAWLREIEARNE